MINRPEPNWQSVAYRDGAQIELAQSDYRGRWHVLYFYPMDFTFICPTEIVGFQSLQSEFAANKIDLIGASTDSYFAHAQWFSDRTIFPEAISHPVLADTAHSVSRAFGVLAEDQGIAYRATVIVDDESLVRSVSINDLSAGRSPSETLRTVIALQSGGLCSADWQKGDAFAA